MPLLLCSELQTGYKAKAKVAHNADHQTSKQFREHWNNITKKQMKNYINLRFKQSVENISGYFFYKKHKYIIYPKPHFFD